ncbi:MAG TPA: 3-hydroxyacyl-CoA dehydrogenase NAD-binding domain-containing protein [Sediminibacterium sp.]|nr:3-hydroxyacyl-CoA dehydrogenase NAD-binding domain-containing protein [Sediminibacterium sp.]
MKAIRTIAVCGAGTMGSGIAQLAAQAGFTTIQFDLNPAALEKSRDAVTAQLNKQVEKAKITAAEKEQVLSRLQFSSDLADCRADIIVEAILENKDIKIKLFNDLTAINEASTIFATNTSSISINAIAAGMRRPEQLVGMHFFNPAPVMKLVEVIHGQYTDPQLVERVYELALRLGKVPVVCKDAPGFIVNRVARHYYLEAMELVEKGLVTIEQADALMEAAGFKMGPFRLMDLIGLDINYSVSNIVWESLGCPERLMPSSLQKAKVNQGNLGKKTGEGFYKY